MERATASATGWPTASVTVKPLEMVRATGLAPPTGRRSAMSTETRWVTRTGSPKGTL
jgi:hypothetical protein